MSQTLIRSKVTTALATWAASKSPALTIARENQPFTKPANYATFLELVIIPADTIVATLDGTRKRFLGEVIINIWTRDGVGTGASELLAEEISNLFPVMPKSYLPVSVETSPSVKRGIQDGTGYRVTPICFSYRAEF